MARHTVKRSTGSTPRRGWALPAVDERLVMPEERYEVLEGRVHYVPPAKEPHGSRHSKVAALLEAHARDEYDVAADMLTRASFETDTAPDVSVFPRARDPHTGGRRLEELTFEIVDRQKLGVASKRARLLAARGVRRLFAVDVKKRRALEWSRPTNTWRMLDPDGSIEDRALVVPLPVEALVAAAKSDDAVARALLAKGNEVLAAELERRQAEGQRQGQLEGRAVALLAVLKGRGLRVTKKDESLIRAERDTARLDAWLERAISCEDVKELLRSAKRRRSR